MPDLGIGLFDPHQYDTDNQGGGGAGDLLPDGIYQLECTASELKPNKAQNGKVTTFRVEVYAPAAHKGKWFRLRFNTNNPNPVAERIGRDELARLCRACGAVNGIRMSEELHHKVFTARVGMEKPQSNSKYAPGNEVKEYFYPDQGNVPAPEVTAEAEAVNIQRQAAASAAPRTATTAAPAPSNGGRPTAEQAAKPRPW